MAAPKRTRKQKEADKERIAEMYLHGKTLRQIGEVIGVSYVQIKSDLDGIRKSWRESSIRDFDSIKSTELAKIDAVESSAWESYEKSLNIFESTITRVKGSTSEASNIEKVIKKEDRNGDPRYLEVIMKCIERRCRIFGIDAPVRNELTGKDGGPIEFEQDPRDVLKQKILEMKRNSEAGK